MWKIIIILRSLPCIKLNKNSIHIILIATCCKSFQGLYYWFVCVWTGNRWWHPCNLWGCWEKLMWKPQWHLEARLASLVPFALLCQELWFLLSMLTLEKRWDFVCIKLLFLSLQNVTTQHKSCFLLGLYVTSAFVVVRGEGRW